MSTPTIQLIGQTREQLTASLQSVNVPAAQLPLRTEQLWKSIYIRGAKSFLEIQSLGLELQQHLAQRFTLNRPTIATSQVSTDGTHKWLLRFPASESAFPLQLSPNELPSSRDVEIETVYIPETNRGTLCLSSQVGCSLSCSFCHTGTQTMVRNLTAAEIVVQILIARDHLHDYAGQTRTSGMIAPAYGRAVSNLVMMGMGEPLFNFENVKAALLIAQDKKGLGLSRRRITLSTSGVVPGIIRTGAEIKCMLAISLHAVTNELRDVLVPINRKYPLEELLAACKNYPGLSNSRRITFEYVMLRDVNDSLADARELIRLLRDIPAKINLIPFNPWPGSNYECSTPEQIEKFAGLLQQHGHVSPIRQTRGEDILAACGQLKSESKRLLTIEQ